MSRGARSSRNTSIIFKLLLPILLLGAIFAFLFIFRMQTITVTGNYHYSDTEVAEIVTDQKLSFNTVYAYLANRNRKPADYQFIDHIEVTLESPDSICIHVSEKKFIGFFYYGEKYWYFNANGIIEAVTDTPEAEYQGEGRYIPCVEGLPIDNVSFGSGFMTGNSSVYKQLEELSDYVSGRSNVPDKVTYDSSMQMILVYGDVKVNMGTSDDLNERFEQLYGILPETEGLSGTLHLENYDENKNQVIFEKDE